MSTTPTTRPKLTDAQLVLLSAASQREDGLVVLIDAHPSVARTIATLLRKELLVELTVQRRQPNWRQDENGKPVGLKLTASGYAAIGVEHNEPHKPETSPAAAPEQMRSGTKLQKVVYLLTRDHGATLNDLMEKTGWLPHTTRGVLSGLRKKGFAISSEATNDDGRRYWITMPNERSATA
jgi:hypothetical protein